MTACSWCHRYVGGEALQCQFPSSDLCASERRKELEAHAINDSYKRAAVPSTAKEQQ